MSTRSRQHHTRSKAGCLTCRKRRVRCDGAKPFWFASVAQHPDALRDTLLIAGLHFAWTVGDLDTYQATLLFHKVMTIRILNGWLQNIQQPGLMTFIRHVSILSFVEGGHGNLAAAETHLDGLANAVDLLSPLGDDFQLRQGVEEELANRYLILFKARVLSSTSLRHMFRRDKTAEFSDFVSLIHHWQTQKIGDLEMRLNAMKLMPFFFAVLPPNFRFHDIDAYPMIECLKNLTISMQVGSGEQKKCDPSWEWIEGSESRLLFATVKSHLTSLRNADDADSRFHPSCLNTSWSSICVACGLYLYGVLDVWPAGQPMELRMFRRFLSILMKDLNQNVDDVKSAMFSDLWFWKAFLGACSLAKRQADAYDEVLEGFERAFDGFILKWSRINSVVSWEDAHLRLLGLTWPLSKAQDFAEGVWKRALGT
ncbi:hypothetical protein NM208_g873 [Fusarium decemcellulare]|uniref:Uncharacterized protein n=1 Tax=Fusarium decemcellulare TaxID=57161 RepID=A0ACC1SY41_9HYPO|nr:hypothetical protein NM208_g873 [Fusarium decemcellulare]